MSATISRENRHTKAHPCPVCDGADGDTRGKSRRCSGFTTDDGYAHCSREELAGNINANGAGLFAHRLRGSCKCGTSHGADVTEKPTIVATYDYRDASGALAYQVVRLLPKDFRIRRPDGSGGHIWSLGGTARVPYRLPELLAADPGRAGPRDRGRARRGHADDARHGRHHQRRRRWQVVLRRERGA